MKPHKRMRRAGKTLWKNVEKVSAVAIILLTVFLSFVAWETLQKTDVRAQIISPQPYTYARDQLVVEGIVTGDPYDSFTVAVDGHPIGGSLPHVLDCRSLHEGDHMVTLQVYDGNVVVAGDQVPFRVDRTPPEILIASPTSDKVVTGLLMPVVGVFGVPSRTELRMQLDGEPLVTPSIDTTSLAEGEHILVVSAVDEAGNFAEQARRFVVDNLAPDVRGLGVDSGARVRAAVELVPDVIEPNVARVTWSMDGIPVCDSLVFALDTRQYLEGEHSLHLVIVDKAGHIGESDTHVTVDNTWDLLEGVWGAVAGMRLSTGYLYFNPHEAFPIIALPTYSLWFDQVAVCITYKVWQDDWFGDFDISGVGFRLPVSGWIVPSKDRPSNVCLYADIGHMYAYLCKDVDSGDLPHPDGHGGYRRRELDKDYVELWAMLQVLGSEASSAALSVGVGLISFRARYYQGLRFYVGDEFIWINEVSDESTWFSVSLRVEASLPSVGDVFGALFSR